MEQNDLRSVPLKDLVNAIEGTRLAGSQAERHRQTGDCT